MAICECIGCGRPKSAHIKTGDGRLLCPSLVQTGIPSSVRDEWECGVHLVTMKMIDAERVKANLLLTELQGMSHSLQAILLREQYEATVARVGKLLAVYHKQVDEAVAKAMETFR